jgi:hypothetical protein
MSRQSLLEFITCKSDTYEKIDGLTLTGGGGDFQMLFSPICERPLFSSGYDVFGVHWTEAKPTSHYTQGQEPILKDIDKWKDEVRFPVVDRFDWGYVTNQAKDFDRNSKVVTCTLAIGPFERTTSLSSFEDCLVNAISEPEEYAELIGALADYKIDIIKHLYQYARPDVINLHDDWGTSISTFFDPELWRETIKPHTKRMYDAIHELGMIVGQHSCGHVSPLIEDMIEIGCDAWEAQANCNDIVGLRAEYGNRICIISPPAPKGDELGEIDDARITRNPKAFLAVNDEIEESAQPATPDPESIPMNYRPYETVPEFLYA